MAEVGAQPDEEEDHLPGEGELERGAAKKQAVLAERIEGLGKDLAYRDALIESLRTLNEDLSRSFENSLKEVGEKTLALQLLQEEIRSRAEGNVPQ